MKIPPKVMEKLVESASQVFVKEMGIPIDQCKPVVTGLIAQGMIRVELSGVQHDPTTWRVRLVLTNKGKRKAAQ